jgi:hypothetical protein
VASGLDESNHEIDVLDYVRQVRELKEGQGDESLLFSTHPSFPFRARALLRFDSVLQHALAGHEVASVLPEVDERIRREMDAAADGAHGSRFKDIALAAAFWRAAHSLCANGRFAGGEQTRMISHFGPDKVAALKRALAAKSQTEARTFLEAKLAEAEAELAQAPLFVERVAADSLVAFAGVNKLKADH